MLSHIYPCLAEFRLCLRIQEEAIATLKTLNEKYKTSPPVDSSFDKEGIGEIFSGYLLYSTQDDRLTLCFCQPNLESQQQ